MECGVLMSYTEFAEMTRTLIHSSTSCVKQIRMMKIHGLTEQLNNISTMAVKIVHDLSQRPFHATWPSLYGTSL
jgi:hypothetical protein